MTFVALDGFSLNLSHWTDFHEFCRTGRILTKFVALDGFSLNFVALDGFH